MALAFLASKESLMFWLTCHVETQPALQGAVDQLMLDTGVDKPLKDLVQGTEQRYWSIIFWVPNDLHRLWDCNNKCSSPDLGNFE